MSQELRQLLSDLADGANWKWYDNKTKLPSENNDDFFETWRHGLSAKAMHEVVNHLRLPGVEHQIVILSKTKYHDGGCTRDCLGCGQFQKVTQDFVVFWEDQGRIRHRLTQVNWVSDMGGFDRAHGLLYRENEITLGEMLEGNDSLIYTLGSHFDYRVMLNSL